MTLDFAVPGDASMRSHYIDLSQCLSLVNRRFYRQGLEYAVAGFKIFSAAGVTGVVVLNKLPDTWMCDNAFTKAYSAWKRQQDDTIEEAGAESAVARWRDFKVFMDVDHVTQYVAGGSDLNVTNLLPYNFDESISTGVESGYGPSFANAYPTGEWQPSEIVVPNHLVDATGSRVDPEEYLLHMVGINNNPSISRGVIEGYADSRAYPQSPDPVEPNLGSSSNWLRDMFDVGNDNVEIIENVTDQNDDLPYDQINYPGGENVSAALQTIGFTMHDSTTISGSSMVEGSNVKCGLIKIQSDMSNLFTLKVMLVPGNTKGYLAERLT